MNFLITRLKSIFLLCFFLQWFLQILSFLLGKIYRLPVKSQVYTRQHTSKQILRSCGLKHTLLQTILFLDNYLERNIKYVHSNLGPKSAHSHIIPTKQKVKSLKYTSWWMDELKIERSLNRVQFGSEKWDSKTHSNHGRTSKLSEWSNFTTLPLISTETSNWPNSKYASIWA